LDWVLLNGHSARVSAETDGIVIAHGLAVGRQPEPSRVPRFERLLPALLVQLHDMEAGFRQDENHWRIPYDQFVAIDEAGIDAFESICRWSPLTLELESTCWLGADDFTYRYRFYRGGIPVATERRGCFVAFDDTVYRLDADCFKLIETVEQYNDESPENRAQGALIQFNRIKGLAKNIGARLDKYLKAERVLLPSRLGVDVVSEAGGRISFAPKIEGVSQEDFTRVFFASDDIEDVYAVDVEGGGRIRVIFDEEQQEVLKRIQRVRHIGGKEKSDIMRDPACVFDGVSGQVEFAFGPRVTGVGDFPFIAQPYIDAATGIFDGYPDRLKPHGEYGIKCTYVDGTTENVAFSSPKELLDFRNDVAEARSKGNDFVEFQGKTISIDTRFIDGLDALIKKITGPSSPDLKPEPKHAGQYVLIYTNESQLEFENSSEVKEDKNEYQPRPPTSLVGEPKRHQTSGYKWLRRTYDRKRTGCLLADDMGLGKTLQVLMFLASLIESGKLADNPDDSELPPWNPILIVSPVILVENGTWQNDMQSFFAAEGSIFEPLCVLHGANLRKFRNSDISGMETVIGQPALRLDDLRKFKVILTNYETVINYQHSFARLHWTAVVTDEAQEYKTPSTKVSHALKALNTRFRIASTGTPVETRLFDVWNLFDFLEPGPLLGSANDFRKTYEPSIQDVNLPKLKERLKLGKPDAHILRRDKEDVLELPPKYEHYLKSEMSAAQIDWHVDLLNRRSGNTRDSHPFSILSNLMRVSQHPRLVPSFEPPSMPEEAIRDCPKLQSVINCLKDIRRESEKALIFTRSIDMQQLLALTLEHVFNFKVYIVNGATKKSGTQGVNNSRKAIVDEFRKSKGFNVLILSPDVAGIGLTIVEANHVIHYGRWWNPAKESQATDRVYRIGQTKPVHVYYPIAVHPTGAFASFDEKLDELLIRRKQLASDFLAPKPSEEELQNALLSSLDVSGEPVPAEQIIRSSDLTRLTWDRFEALVALIEEKRGHQSWLSPKSGDGGIDIVSRLGSQIRLVQCKHTQWTSTIDKDTISELIDSSDAFRASLNVSGFTFKPVLVTNASVTRVGAEYAADRNVEVVRDVNFDSYLGKISCSRAEIEDVERRRYPSLPRMKAELVEILRYE